MTWIKVAGPDMMESPISGWEASDAIKDMPTIEIEDSVQTIELSEGFNAYLVPISKEGESTIYYYLYGMTTILEYAGSGLIDDGSGPYRNVGSPPPPGLDFALANPTAPQYQYCTLTASITFAIDWRVIRYTAPAIHGGGVQYTYYGKSQREPKSVLISGSGAGVTLAQSLLTCAGGVIIRSDPTTPTYAGEESFTYDANFGLKALAKPARSKKGWKPVGEVVNGIDLGLPHGYLPKWHYSLTGVKLSDLLFTPMTF